jgi:uncharacterized membrane protein
MARSRSSDGPTTGRHILCDHRKPHGTELFSYPSFAYVQEHARLALIQSLLSAASKQMFDHQSASDPSRSHRAKQAGVVVVFLWFLIGGIAHFAATDIEVRLVPPYIPWPFAVVLVTGVLELLGAAGLLLKSTRRAAGIGLFALTICVTPVHIYMLQQPELFSVPYWALVLRLPLQVALLALIAWSTFSKTERI